MSYRLDPPLARMARWLAYFERVKTRSDNATLLSGLKSATKLWPLEAREIGLVCRLAQEVQASKNPVTGAIIGGMGALPPQGALTYRSVGEPQSIAIGPVTSTPDDLKSLIEALCICSNCRCSIKVTSKVITWAKAHEQSMIYCESCIDNEAAGCLESNIAQRTLTL